MDRTEKQTKTPTLNFQSGKNAFTILLCYWTLVSRKKGQRYCTSIYIVAHSDQASVLLIEFKWDLYQKIPFDLENAVKELNSRHVEVPKLLVYTTCIFMGIQNSLRTDKTKTKTKPKQSSTDFKEPGPYNS